MRITFVTRKFGNVERNSHCDVLHITPIRVANLVLDCNGDFAIKAYSEESFYHCLSPDPDLDPDNLRGGHVLGSTPSCVKKNPKSIGAIVFSVIRADRQTDNKQINIPKCTTLALCE